MDNYSEILLLNETTLNDTVELYFAKRSARGISTFFVGLMMFITNLLVVISSGLLIKKGTKPKCPYLLLGNIALTELITGIIAMMIWFYPNNPHSAFPCFVYIGVYTTTTTVSFYSVALIALDRFLYIIHGLKYNTMIYPTRVRTMIGLTWILSISIGFVPVMILAEKGPYCWHSFIIPRSLIITLNSSGLFPIIFILVLYAIILRKAIKTGGKMQTVTNADQMVVAQYDEHNRLRFSIVSKVSSVSGSIDTTRTDGSDVSQNVSSLNKDNVGSTLSEDNRNGNRQTNNNTKNGLSPKQWKAVKIVFFTAGNELMIFILYSASTIISLTCDREKDSFYCDKLEIDVVRYVGLGGLAHHMFNPIIYYWWHNGFRNIINKLFRK